MLIAFLTAAAAAPVAAAPPPACPVQQARYAMRAEPAVTARFHPVARNADWRSGLALEIRIGASGRSYWWLPWNGGTDGKTHVRWAQERRAEPVESRALNSDLDFFSTDTEYRFHNEVPRAGDAAPAHLFLPDLPHALWYLTRHDRRDSAPRAFFDLVGCAAPSPGEIAPDVALPPVP